MQEVHWKRLSTHDGDLNQRKRKPTPMKESGSFLCWGVLSNQQKEIHDSSKLRFLSTP